MPLIVVAGPPGAGKTTLVHSRHQPGDLVWDLDAVYQALTLAADPHDRPVELPDLISAVRKVVARWLHLHPAHTAWWITSAPEPVKRETYQHQGATVLVVATPLDVCLARLEDRGASPDVIDAARRWWDQYRPARGDQLVTWD